MPDTTVETTNRLHKQNFWAIRSFGALVLAQLFWFHFSELVLFGGGRIKEATVFKSKPSHYRDKICVYDEQTIADQDICYSSVKYKSNSLNCSTKIIKSAPKLNRSTCANKILQV